MREPTGAKRKPRTTATARTTTPATKIAVAKAKAAAAVSKPSRLRENAVLPAGGSFGRALARVGLQKASDLVQKRLAEGAVRPVRAYPPKGTPVKPYVNRGRYEQFLEENISGGPTVTGRFGTAAKSRPGTKGTVMKKEAARIKAKRAAGKPVPVRPVRTPQTKANNLRDYEQTMTRTRARTAQIDRLSAQAKAAGRTVKKPK